MPDQNVDWSETNTRTAHTEYSSTLIKWMVLNLKKKKINYLSQ